MDGINAAMRDDEMDNTSYSGSETRPDTPALSVENLSKRYGETQAVDDVNFSIKQGRVVGLLGPNGAGKTTTIKCMLGLIIPSSGTVRVGDIDVQSNPKQAYKQIGATLEGARNTYWRLSVLENLHFFSALAGNDPRNQRDYHRSLLSKFGIEDKADTVVRELSRGQKQKVSLACALSREAAFLFLDEPTLGLDVESSLELRSELRRLAEDNETTVLISSHDMDVIEDICDQVIIMNEGRVITNDSVENLLNIFNTQRYEVTVLGNPSQQTRRQLGTAYGVESFESEAKRTRFKASVSSENFYEFIDILQNDDLPIASINTVDSDMEHVFLEATDSTEQNTIDRTVQLEDASFRSQSGPTSESQ